MESFTDALQTSHDTDTSDQSPVVTQAPTPTPSVSVSDALGWSLGLSQSPSSSQTGEDLIVKFVEELAIPAQAPLDLKAKVAVCLIHLFFTAPKVCV